jgi:hypothetical protein
MLKPINEHKNSFSGCMKPNVSTQKVMAERTIIRHLVNTYSTFGYGFCLETGWFTLFTQILIFLNTVNHNGCAHIRAIIFILTSNSGNPTPEFQGPLSHYVFRQAGLP